MPAHRFKLLATTLLSAALLTACGGGGGGSTSSGSGGGGTTAPTVSASSDTGVAKSSEGTITLTTSASNTTSYAWTQTSGTAVTFSTTDANPTFATPTLPATFTQETLEFSVTVTGDGGTATDTVSVIVSDGALPAYAAQFDTASLADGTSVEVVDCNIDNKASLCLSMTLKTSPGSRIVGPFCPTLTVDDASTAGVDESEGGIWIKSDLTLHDVDGAFITDELQTLYGGSGSDWIMYDATTNEVFHTEGTTECQAAANPQPDASLADHCVECLVSDIQNVAPSTYEIALVPTVASAVTVNGSNGVTFSGSYLDNSAPLPNIEGNRNIAPFDSCGGHINPAAGYHLHAATDADGCYNEIASLDGHADQMGIALDGFPVFEQLNGTTEPSGLDSCRGHFAADEASFDLGDIDYHYHVNDPSQNDILPCLVGQVPN